MICLLLSSVVYLLGALVFGLLTYIISNPYGHITKLEQWKQTPVYGAFWPFALVYIVATVVWYNWINPPRD